MPNELLHCPFCGKKMLEDANARHGLLYTHPKHEDGEWPCPAHAINFYEGSRMAERWNTRAKETHQPCPSSLSDKTACLSKTGDSDNQTSEIPVVAMDYSDLREFYIKHNGLKNADSKGGSEPKQTKEGV
jgi:uncharacterized Zn finger protein (UPF0148 family)